MATKKEVTKKPIEAEVVEKSTPKTVKTTAKAAKPVVIKIETKPGALSVPMFSLAGASAGSLSLPKEIFGEKVNKSLLSQAMRVYTTNQKAHHGSNKTRGEVIGSTKKIYRQKGTGGARHGAKAAPIFVGGGVTFASKYRKTILDLPKKMKKAALISAFSQKVLDGEIFAIDGLEKATGKTKQMATLFKGFDKKSALIIDQTTNPASRAVGNIAGISFLTADQVNAYEVIRHQSIILTKAAVEKLQKNGAENKKAEKELPAVSSQPSEKTEVVKKSKTAAKAAKKETKE